MEKNEPIIVPLRYLSSHSETNRYVPGQGDNKNRWTLGNHISRINIYRTNQRKL